MTKCVPFWREYELHGYMSQWYISPMTIDGVTYNCCEQFMMAEKARKFNDTAALAAIMGETDPFKQKKLGRAVKNFVKEEWDAACRPVVYRGNLAKFEQNDELKKLLLATGDAILVEASPVDRIWGIGLAPNHPSVCDPTKWRGTNWLGEAIMQVRTSLRMQ